MWPILASQIVFYFQVYVLAVAQAKCIPLTPKTLNFCQLLGSQPLEINRQGSKDFWVLFLSLSFSWDPTRMKILAASLTVSECRVGVGVGVGSVSGSEVSRHLLIFLKKTSSEIFSATLFLFICLFVCFFGFLGPISQIFAVFCRSWWVILDVVVPDQLRFGAKSFFYYLFRVYLKWKIKLQVIVSDLNHLKSISKS